MVKPIKNEWPRPWPVRLQSHLFGITVSTITPGLVQWELPNLKDNVKLLGGYTYWKWIYLTSALKVKVKFLKFTIYVMTSHRSRGNFVEIQTYKDEWLWPSPPRSSCCFKMLAEGVMLYCVVLLFYKYSVVVSSNWWRLTLKIPPSCCCLLNTKKQIMKARKAVVCALVPRGWKLT